MEPPEPRALLAAAVAAEDIRGALVADEDCGERRPAGPVHLRPGQGGAGAAPAASPAAPHCPAGGRRPQHHRDTVQPGGAEAAGLPCCPGGGRELRGQLWPLGLP